MIPTPHIEIKDKSLVAETVLMPGDPLRAKYIADNFLKDPVLINKVRNMFGYTGEYNGKKITVFGSGMGMPSMGIYSYELFSFYDVKNIIRIGSAGAYTESLKVFDVLLATSSWSESSFAKVQDGSTYDTIKPSEQLNNKIKESAKKQGIGLKEGGVHSSDVFYSKDHDAYKNIYKQHGCLCVEMESFALFHNAKHLNKNASCLMTITDHLVSREAISSDEREIALNNMIKIALGAAFI